MRIHRCVLWAIWNTCRFGFIILEGVSGLWKSLAQPWLGRGGRRTSHRSHQAIIGAVVTAPRSPQRLSSSGYHLEGDTHGPDAFRADNESNAAPTTHIIYKKVSNECNDLIFDLGGGTFFASLPTIEEGVFLGSRVPPATPTQVVETPTRDLSSTSHRSSTQARTGMVSRPTLMLSVVPVPLVGAQSEPSPSLPPLPSKSIRFLSAKVERLAHQKHPPITQNASRVGVSQTEVGYPSTSRYNVLIMPGKLVSPAHFMFVPF